MSLSLTSQNSQMQRRRTGQAPVLERSSTCVGKVKRLCWRGQAPALERSSTCVAEVKHLCYGD
jgi:hypothetical protein